MIRKFAFNTTFFATLLIVVFGFARAAVAQETELPVITKTETIDAAGLKALLPTAENKRPVLINFWATWCGPCRVEFPDLVKIDSDYRAKGLNFYVVSVDDVVIIERQVALFLRQYNSTMPSYLINLPNRREIARAVRQIFPKFTDKYPLTLLFDAEGRLVYQKNGVINEKLLRAQIDKVLPKNETR